MFLRVFISHQRADTDVAARIAARLRISHQIDSYVDVIDPAIVRGEDLAAHIRSRMGSCTQLLAVISSATRDSQWVPWEIGVATEKEFPLATFSATLARPPEFLQKWPYLRTDADLDAYARASKAAATTYGGYVRLGKSLEGRTASTREFYKTLRSSLGQ